jgi:hypothetical protein
MKYMEKEFAALGPERFARERLGKSEWPSGEPGEWQVFSEADWLAATGPDSPLQAGPVPVPVPAPAREFDPFAAWGPDGVPPWVQRAG